MTSHIGSASSPPPRAQDTSLGWTDDLPVCHQSGVGFATNQVNREDGFRIEEHEFEDRSIHFSLDDGTCLYGVFDGHEGSRVSNFAAQRMPAELLLGQLHENMTDIEIHHIMQQAFISVEKGYFDSIDDELAKKAELRLQIGEGLSALEMQQNHPELYRQLCDVEKELSGGATAVVALIYQNKLHVANVGCSRALFCQIKDDGHLWANQLSCDHDLRNKNELQRLRNIGVDVDKLIQYERVNGHVVYTRTFGDYTLKTEYKDNELMRGAISEPVVADPYVCRSIDLSEVKEGFLVLMSYGMYKSLEDTGDDHINTIIASMVAQSFSEQSTLNGVTQAVVDKVVIKHHDAFMISTDARKELCRKRKDITLLVRNFNYPLPNAMNSPTSGRIANPVFGGRFPPMPSNTQISNLSINIPLSVDIPGGPNPCLESNPLMIMTNSTSHGEYSGTVNSEVWEYENENTESTNSDAAMSGEDARQPRPVGGDYRESLPLDADGRVIPYVDFSNFFTILNSMSPGEKEEFSKETEIKPEFETIPEDGEVTLTRNFNSAMIFSSSDLHEDGDHEDGDEDSDSASSKSDKSL